jgi:hypothetical protein
MLIDAPPYFFQSPQIQLVWPHYPVGAFENNATLSLRPKIYPAQRWLCEVMGQVHI